MTEIETLSASSVIITKKPSEVTSFPQVKILVVDDNKDNSRALANLIEYMWKMDDWPLNIVCVTTMADAMREKDDANATFLDLDLPDSTIDQSIGSIHLFQPPVIVLTGHDDPTLSSRCMEAGAEFVFIKGSIESLIPQLFASLQKDLIRRYREIYGKQ